MDEGLGRDAARALGELDRLGLLLVTDARLPSLVALVAGGPVRGSWWGHAKGGAIFVAASQLEDHPDVALVKLVSGKATFVHRRLWPALLGVAQAGEPWQREGLPAAALRLWRRLQEAGTLRGAPLRGARDDVRALEARLLAYARSVHTASGAHEKELESWRHWAARLRVKPLRDAPAARRRLQEALREMASGSGGQGRLPWP